MHYDIFNGDADGICALHQLRLADPKPDSHCITGVKRDIKLLQRDDLQSISEATLTILDISMDSNMDNLQEILFRKNSVTYIDHHAADPIPENSFLTAHINLQPDTCTSLIVNELLGGQYAAWAVCGAFGDNLHVPAKELAEKIGLGNEETELLKETGELLNYNGYGASVSDLHFDPAELYTSLRGYINPLEYSRNSKELSKLREGYKQDMEQALSCKEYPTPGKNRVFLLPDAPWARRVSGVFANLKARERTVAAHALITENSDGTLRISVRAPLDDRRDAVTLCKQFPTGGGRAAAAGINSMPANMLDDFLKALDTIYS